MMTHDDLYCDSMTHKLFNKGTYTGKKIKIYGHFASKNIGLNQKSEYVASIL